MAHLGNDGHFLTVEAQFVATAQSIYKFEAEMARAQHGFVVARIQAPIAAVGRRKSVPAAKS